jgi:proteasome assembly chaperone (PAC2) family protein
LDNGDHLRPVAIYVVNAGHSTHLFTTGRIIMDVVNFHREPPSNLTTMVVAFGGWINAGRAATGALRYLVRHLAASHLASIDPEEFFVFTEERPHVRMADDGSRTIRWPRGEFFMWQPSDSRTGLLLFRGREPHQRWRTYTTALLDVAEQCGVTRIVSLGAFLAGAPHTRPTLVTARSTDPDWQALLKEWGIYRRPSYEGPTGIVPVFLAAATGRGVPHLDFMGQAPYYLQNIENPAVTQALLRYLGRLLNLELDVTPFDEAVKLFRAQCDQAIAGNASIQAHVRQLEQEHDAAAGEASEPLQEEELNPQQLIQEVEDFLREEREGGEPGAEPEAR